ncbi:unnamed protein product [Brachionus calyciflorus]|uniref:Uncharacterized protein n=1 Tax=Brachionus calyciflorus TaxID=104777 RepID=A0A814KAN8_9BILA|nr:unnamed protein product [Brachionus calyciflorus]
MFFPPMNDCLKCKIHCENDHIKLIQEKLELEQVNLDLKRQLATLQVEKMAFAQPNNRIMITNSDINSIEKCELLFQREALKEININLQMVINDLKGDNENLKKRISNNENTIRDLNSRLSQNDKLLSFVAQRVFEMAPVGFRIVIEELLSINYNSQNLSKDYLQSLKQYFSSFVHHKASNIISPNTDEMNNWLEATLKDHETLVRNYTFNNSRKNLEIVLKKEALVEIINFWKNKNQENFE